MQPEVETEASSITDTLREVLPPLIEGRHAVSELREADYQWRQMEWIGWYFEYAARSALIRSLGGQAGPRFGSTAFDYQRKHVWDLKAHPRNSSRGVRSDLLILNDAEAMDLCAERYGGVGFIVAEGEAVYDADGAFKAWHDALKGGMSAYEVQRVRRGAGSRIRKSAFRIQQYSAVYLRPEHLGLGIRDGWLRYFQEGMRNADGSPRRRKYLVATSAIPAPNVVATSEVVL
jgi:hypothetical protein